MASVAHQAWKIGSFTLFPKKPKRDFVYIDDVVSATLYPLSNNIESGVYEVGCGEARTFEDVLDIMEIPFEYKGEYEIPKGYQFFTQSESKLFMEGWQPKYSLEDGLQKYKDYLNGVV